MSALPPISRKGPLAWMAENSVAANLLMLLLVIGGIVMAAQVRQEVFPEFDLDMITVLVEYRGATPADVEQGAILAIEEEVRSLDGIKAVNSVSREGGGTVSLELLAGARSDLVLNDVQSAVERITSFPADMERPQISIATNRQQVLTLLIHGDAAEHSLRSLAERTRDGLQSRRDITLAEVSAVRPPELAIEIDGATLRRHGLTLDGVARVVREAGVELPGGGIRTAGGEVLVRTDERRERGEEFEDVVIVAEADGSVLRLGDIAHISDDFREVDRESWFNGRPAAAVVVYRVGNETPISISEAVHAYIDENADLLPPGIEYEVWADSSEIYRDRIGLLMKNAYIGLVLVLLVLGLFLEMKLAFWVTMGIPIAILGSLTLMPAADVSFNMISLFAFILTLGIVVDDAIVVGESIYKQRERGYGLLDAAIAGVREVGPPIVFSVLTTIMVFVPLLFVPGISGKFFGVIPKVVILVLLLSLVEALLVLPAHLAHSNPVKRHGLLGTVVRAQQAFSSFFEDAVRRAYAPTLRIASEARYLVIAIGVAMLLVSLAFVASGQIPFTFFPRVEGDVVNATARLPFGVNFEETRRTGERLELAAQELLDEHSAETSISRGVYRQLGEGGSGMGPRAGAPPQGGHLVSISVYLVGLDGRDITSMEFARAWRERVGELAGVENMTFGFATGPSAGAAVDIELSHQDPAVLEEAAARLASVLATLDGVADIDDGVSRGKEQLDLRLRPEARSLGLSEGELGRQVRAAFFGVEALRLQRGRDELRVLVRSPLAEREQEATLENMMLRTPMGGEVPLAEVASVERSRSHVQIRRRDGRRVLNVQADVVEGVTTGNEVVTALRDGPLDDLMGAFPGLSWSLAGEQQEQGETMGSLGLNFLLALIAMYGLLAVAFRSYVQPIIVMTAIPFGFIGAIIGHLIMGYGLSFMSMMGVIALSGIVVNSSLLLISTTNDFIRGGMDPREAIIAGCVRRFRPVILTALTTFFGLMPMILETSVQARFLIPMAISLGFGVLFSSFITLVIVPALFLVTHDLGAGRTSSSTP